MGMWAPGAPPRDLQLVVGFYWDRSISARPLRRGTERRQLKRKTQEAAVDDELRVLEPLMPGQLSLFAMPRRLTEETVRAITQRQVRGWDQARAVLVEMAAEHGLSAGWHFKVAEMLRLALAVREAEGAERLPERALRDLPRNGDAVRLVLSRSGMLEPAPAPLRFSRTDQPSAVYLTDPVPLPSHGPCSCRDCQAWMPTQVGFVCRPCAHWRERYARGRCERCRREGLALREGRCRLCHLYLHLDAAAPAMVQATQLPIDLPLGTLGPARALSVDAAPNREDLDRLGGYSVPGQEALFTLSRDWAPVLARVRRHGRLPLPLTETAAALVDDFARLRRDTEQDPLFHPDVRTLRILLFWLGGENAVWEGDIHDLARSHENLKAKRVCQFLRSRDLLAEDPARHRDRHLEWTEAAIAALPTPVGEEVRTWVTVLRGQGRREHQPRGYDYIRRNLAALRPVLTGWAADGMTTLRQITPDDIETAVAERRGAPGRHLAVCLRSLFRALRQERVIFRDPTRNLVVGGTGGLPNSVPSDVLAGLLDQVKNAFGRLVIALVTVHALPGHEVRTLLTEDLDLSRGTLQIRRGLPRHTVYLEEFTHQLAADWLTYRHRRWPASTNPHLLVSQHSALDQERPPVSIGTVRMVFPKGVTMDGLRQDRILDEAFDKADPLHLMRLFGITAQRAMRYIKAAHPERTAKLPR
ncbi:hypothetical protein [Streptomyces sp. bgisy034]|uniref:hypothetical protein n=1 Tax=Streptomyces sp. bgisy034 TaxID=3413774 RepID=UPI003EBC46AE